MLRSSPVGERGPRGRINAVIAAREFIDALFAAMPPFSRAVAEPELAQPTDGWRWCESDRSGFVRTEDGAAFSVSRAPDAALPPELAIALTQAVRNDRAPANVVVDRSTDAATLARWQAGNRRPLRRRHAVAMGGRTPRILRGGDRCPRCVPASIVDAYRADGSTLRIRIDGRRACTRVARIGGSRNLGMATRSTRARRTGPGSCRTGGRDAECRRG